MSVNLPRHISRFTVAGSLGFAMGHPSGLVTLCIGSTADHTMTFRMKAAEARAIANALYEAADGAENVLATGLGESAVVVAPAAAAETLKIAHNMVESPDNWPPMRVKQVAAEFLALAEGEAGAERNLNEQAREDVRRIHAMSHEWGDSSGIAEQPGDSLTVKRVRALLALYHEAAASSDAKPTAAAIEAAS